ncbi:FtsX-like permease family protein [Asanoa sp. NPDC049573]|uniref:FtsX-like permease family protein n=1 Tax=Asanoa sp. NPDC049573 TaxID=3155396 RepID=UPI003438C8B3
MTGRRQVRGVAWVAVRMAVGGRDQLTRLLVMSLGVALGAGLLLLAAVTLPAIHAHEMRDAWTRTSAHNVRPAQDEAITDPLLWRTRTDSFAGQEILRVDVAALGPRAPLPPGLSRLPGPGQRFVSPALRRLLARTPADQLALRFPGRDVGSVGDAALRSPDALVVVVGYDPAVLRGQPAVEQVRSIETQPASVSLTRFGRVVAAIAVAALLVPILVLVATATRLSAARRERRLAAIRLIGATPRQTDAVATAEAVLAAVVGTGLGFVLFAVARPFAARWSVDGSPFFPADLRLTGAAAVAVVLGVPVLAAVAALVALRQVRISPLGVSRQARTGRPTVRRLIPLLVGLSVLAVAIPAAAASRAESPLWLLAAAMTAVIVGIVVAGPWLTMGIGRLVVRTARGAPTLLAGHRLAGDPAAGFRSISGLVLAVFLATITMQAAASAADPAPGPDQVLVPAGAVGAEFLYRGTPPLPAAAATTLAGRVRRLPGVRAVADLRWADPAPPRPDAGTLPVVARCADLRATTLVATCPDPAATVGLDARGLGNGVMEDIQATTGAVDGLPMLALLVTTDGTQAAIERVRTLIEASADQLAWLPWTTAEVKAHADKQAEQTDRIAIAILLATLVVAGFSLAVATADGLLRRRRPFALLRLTGIRVGDLRRVVLIETALPLLAATGISAGIGLAVAADVTHASHLPWRSPPAGYWWLLAAGTGAALVITLALSLPLLGRLSSIQAPHDD